MESNWDPNNQCNPHFTTDSYGLDNMEPRPATQSRKKQVKAKAKKLSFVEVIEEYAPGRQNYIDEETMLLTKCWAYERQNYTGSGVGLLGLGHVCLTKDIVEHTQRSHGVLGPG